MSRSDAAYEFGDYRLDPHVRVLSLRERPIALAPKSFDLLRLMIERRGRLLARDELIRELWPDTVVEEANLTFQVSTLRKALGKEGSQWIETVPKHGYRFMAPVREVREAPDAPGAREASELVEAHDQLDPLDAPFPAAAAALVNGVPAAIPSPSPDTGPFRPIALTAAALLVAITLAALAAVGSSGWMRRGSLREASDRMPAASVAVPLTTYPGLEGTPTLSPDGSQVAFAWDGPANDNLDIYLKLVGPGEPHRLTTDPGADHSPAWSPDGRQLAFMRAMSDDGRNGIYLMPALGGPERRLADIDLTPFRTAPGTLLAWTPDGKWLAAAGRFDPASPSEVWLLSPDTGERRRLTTAGVGQIGDFGISFSPDGRYLAILRYATRSVGDIHVQRLDARAGYAPRGPLVRLTRESRLVGGPAWNATGDRIYFSTGGGAMGYRTLQMVMFDPGTLDTPRAPLPLPAGEHATTLAAARNRLVYAREQRDTNIWRLPLTRPLESGGTPSMMLSSTFDEHNPDFSADGMKVTFTSTRSGTEEIWMANADGSEATQMTSMGGANTSNSRWSPDGRSILFNSRRSGSSDLYLVDVATHAVQKLTDDPADEYEPRWSRDGRSIYFASTRTGRPEVWKMPVGSAVAGVTGGGTAVQVTRDGGAAAFESVDGRWVYYAKTTRPLSIWRMPVGGGEEAKIVDFLSYNFNFAVAAKGIYLLASRGRGASIEYFDFATEKTTPLYSLDRPFWFGFAVSPDERSILFSKIDSWTSDLMVVDNLRRR